MFNLSESEVISIHEESMVPIVLKLPPLNNKYWLLSRGRLQQKAHISGMLRIGPP